jgi:hypothetical protein
LTGRAWNEKGVRCAKPVLGPIFQKAAACALKLIQSALADGQFGDDGRVITSRTLAFRPDRTAPLRKCALEYLLEDRATAGRRFDQVSFRDCSSADFPLI